MLNNEQYIEQIEAYLKGELNPEASSVLEIEISKNPILKNELDIQNSIVEVLRKNRKAELKQRLNSIDVKSGSQTWWKYAAVAGLVTTFGAWMYFNNSAQIQENDTQVAKAKEVAPLNQEVEDNTVMLAPKENKSTDIAVKEKLAEKNVKANTASESRSTKSKEKKSKDQLPSLPTLQMPEGSNEHEPINKDLDAPKQSLTNTPHISTSLAGVEVVRSKKHKFHYRYFDAKLFLYGNFDSDTYDILELNTSKGQSLYLKYENNYFSLEQNRTEISKLEMVKDRQILKDLEEIQNK